MILNEPNSLFHASSFDIDGNGTPNVFSATNAGNEHCIISLNYDGVGDITSPSSYSVDSLAFLIALKVSTFTTLQAMYGLILFLLVI